MLIYAWFISKMQIFLHASNILKVIQTSWEKSNILKIKKNVLKVKKKRVEGQKYLKGQKNVLEVKQGKVFITSHLYEGDPYSPWSNIYMGMSLGHPRILLPPSWRRDVKSPLVVLGTSPYKYYFMASKGPPHKGVM